MTECKKQSDDKGFFAIAGLVMVIVGISSFTSGGDMSHLHGRMAIFTLLPWGGLIMAGMGVILILGYFGIIGDDEGD